MNSQPTYTLTIRENGKQIRQEAMRDPFHTTTIQPRGWRTALRVLFHRYEIRVMVDADPLTVERVLHLNPDYLPFHGQRREEWNAELQEALSAVGVPRPKEDTCP